MIFVYLLSYSEIRRVVAPMLFLSGLSDQLIPSHMMLELYQVRERERERERSNVIIIKW